MTRRLLAILAACTTLLGLAAVPFAAPTRAEVTHVYSPAPAGLARVCVIVRSADSGLCLHI